MDSCSGIPAKCNKACECWECVKTYLAGLFLAQRMMGSENLQLKLESQES